MLHLIYCIQGMQWVSKRMIVCQNIKHWNVLINFLVLFLAIEKKDCFCINMSLCFVNRLPNFWHRTYQAVGVISLIYAPVITIANILLVVSFIATKQTLKQASNFLIVCISVSDALFGAILMPLVGFINAWYQTPKNCLLYHIAYTSQIFFCGVSIQMTTLLALDRYLHMNPDFQASSSRFSKLFKRPYIYGTVTLVYLLTGLIILCIHFTPRSSMTSAYINMFFVFFIFFYTTFVVVIYIRGYMRIRRYVDENPVYARREDSGPSERPEYLKQLFKTVLILLITMFVAWMPIFALPILNIIHSFTNYIDYDAIFFLSETAYLFFDLNAAINALIIFYRNKKSREWLGKCFRWCCRLRNGEEAQNGSEVITNIGATRGGEIQLQVI